MTWQPETKFPSVGRVGKKLYRVGLCKICNLLLMGEQPVRRDHCWWHDPGNIGKNSCSDLFAEGESLTDIALSCSNDIPKPSGPERES